MYRDSGEAHVLWSRSTSWGGRRYPQEHLFLWLTAETPDPREPSPLRTLTTQAELGESRIAVTAVSLPTAGQAPKGADSPRSVMLQ